MFVKSYLNNLNKIFTEIFDVCMCKIMEDKRNEGAREAALDNARETARRMIKDGELSIEKIARYIPFLSMDELKELEAEVMQLA